MVCVARPVVETLGAGAQHLYGPCNPLGMLNLSLTRLRKDHLVARTRKRSSGRTARTVIAVKGLKVGEILLAIGSSRRLTPPGTIEENY